MSVNNRVFRPLSRLFRNRRGTAEIVGSVMFLVILLFFFSNVFLWHDQASREMDGVVSDRVNSPVTIEKVEDNPTTGWLKLQVNNEGGVGCSLSRLWIIEKYDSVEYHEYGDIEEISIGARWLSGGASMNVTLLEGSGEAVIMDDGVGVYYYKPSVEDVEVTFKILTDLGNTAACKYVT
jgi:hypothetical protein